MEIRPPQEIQSPETLRCGDLLFQLAAQKVVHQSPAEPRELVLTPLEFRLLLHFASHEAQVLSRDRLIEAVWGNGVHVLDRTIDTHISNLRKKIAATEYEFRAVHGVGYEFRRKNEGRFRTAA